LESSCSSFSVKTAPLPLLPIEKIGIPLRSGLDGLNTAAIPGKINPTDSVITPRLRENDDRIIASALNPYPPISTFPLKEKGLKNKLSHPAIRTLLYA
jgi:hypothetical protein